VKRREEKRSEVNIIHYDLSDFFSLFTLAFSEISSQEKNQISVIVKEYDPPISLAEQYGIFKSLIKRIQDGPEKKKTKAYLFGTYKIMLQDSCGALSREESQKLKKQMIHDFEK
jgi:LysM repeat protein